MLLVASLSSGQTGERRPGWVVSETTLGVPDRVGSIDILRVEIDESGRRPVVLLTHGTSPDLAQRLTVTPWSYFPQALWFAKRGFVVLVVVRRGYGPAGGPPDVNVCAGASSFLRAGKESSLDLRAAIDYAKSLPNVDPTRIVSIGDSSGGFAQLALASTAPNGLRAAINFAGGRGSLGNGSNCDLAGLTTSLREFGRTAQIPTMWIYAENDKWFPPAIAQTLIQAFRAGGASAQLVIAPAFRADGHALFTDVDSWAVTVQNFLGEQRLMPHPPVSWDFPPRPNQIPSIAQGGRQALRALQVMKGAKAFAIDNGGAWGVAADEPNHQSAVTKALANCNFMAAAEGKDQCFIFASDAD
jgi:dienelactone hydrolase